MSHRGRFKKDFKRKQDHIDLFFSSNEYLHENE